MRTTTLARRALVAEIHRVATEIDRLQGTAPGTAEHGIYWAYWPPSQAIGVDVLANLLADARRFRDQAAAKIARSA
jgi:hypothetical protein